MMRLLTLYAIIRHQQLTSRQPKPFTSTTTIKRWKLYITPFHWVIKISGFQNWKSARTHLTLFNISFLNEEDNAEDQIQRESVGIFTKEGNLGKLNEYELHGQQIFEAHSRSIGFATWTRKEFRAEHKLNNLLRNRQAELVCQFKKPQTKLAKK